MNLDLGEAEKISVKVAGESYEMRLPLVSEFEKLQELGKKQDFDSIQDLYISLGLPEEVLTSLDMKQFKRLSEGLSGVLEKK